MTRLERRNKKRTYGSKIPLKKSRKKRKIQKAFLNSMLAVSCLMLCVLAGSGIHMHLAEKQKDSGQSTMGTAAQPAGSSHGSSHPPSLSADAGRKNPDTVPQPEKSVNSKHPVLNKPEPEKEQEPAEDTTLVFAGDVYFSDYVLACYDQSGIQGILAENLLKELKQADLAIVNNEFPYSTRGVQAPDKQFTFRVDPSYVSILSDAGVDLVTLANNHVLDYGTDALSDTFQTLDHAGIDYAGAGKSLKRASKLIRKHINGHTLGFLAASRVFPDVSWNVENAQPGVFSAYDPSRLLAAVQDARSQCDFLCVYVHWGIERNTAPEEYQVSLAHALIDAGADAVIGAHPHVLQGVEYYQGKPVFYSLGNFIFYQSIERTAVAKLTLSADHTAKWQLLPAKASNTCTSLLTDTAACREFYQYMSGLSVNTDFSANGLIKSTS